MTSIPPWCYLFFCLSSMNWKVFLYLCEPSPVDLMDAYFLFLGVLYFGICLCYWVGIKWDATTLAFRHSLSILASKTSICVRTGKIKVNTLIIFHNLVSDCSLSHVIAWNQSIRPRNYFLWTGFHWLLATGIFLSVVFAEDQNSWVRNAVPQVNPTTETEFYTWLH